MIGPVSPGLPGSLDPPWFGVLATAHTGRCAAGVSRPDVFTRLTWASHTAAGQDLALACAELVAPAERSCRRQPGCRPTRGSPWRASGRAHIGGQPATAGRGPNSGVAVVVGEVEAATCASSHRSIRLTTQRVHRAAKCEPTARRTRLRGSETASLGGSRMQGFATTPRTLTSAKEIASNAAKL